MHDKFGKTQQNIFQERQKDTNVKIYKRTSHQTKYTGCKNVFTFSQFKPNYAELDHFPVQSTLCYAGLLYLPAETC